jgi:hypothetical protein
MSVTGLRDAAPQEMFALPLVIAVTGHRDLVAGEVPGIRDRVRELFRQLREGYPERRLQVFSPLAEGADRLVAEEALALGVELHVVLPMPEELYLRDFPSEESRTEFQSLAARAAGRYALSLFRGVTADEIVRSEHARGMQYAQLGVFLCAHCHILLALWDGKPSTKLGGTGQIVRFHHDNIMPGYSGPTVASQQMLVDDESDLVYHIVCSRDRPDGAPRPGLEPLDWWWFTKDREHPRSKEPPRQHHLIFRRSGEFSEDSLRFSEQIEAWRFSLLEPGENEFLPPGIDNINRLFCIADWLAIHFQKRTLFTFQATHVLAFLMGIMFLLYDDLRAWQYLMYAFLFFFLLAATVQFVGRKQAWHRKYLDYRTLAEGLRVQFYWAAAGVTNDLVSKFTHDHFLQTQDPELGWIRNVMRVAGTRCDMESKSRPEGIRFAIREWIGDAETGQLGYFRKKSKERVAKNRNTDRLARLSLLASIAVVGVMIVVGTRLPGSATSWLQVFMGATLLLFGVRQGYAHSTAEKELIKQYEFMLRIFLNARRRLDHADDDMERKQILRALGGSALDEHAEWILMHRDRSPDQGEIWRMGS